MKIRELFEADTDKHVTFCFGRFNPPTLGHKEVFKKIKKSNHLNRLITLSPLTEMATKFHSKNGAKLLKVNENTQNFEYEVM